MTLREWLAKGNRCPTYLYPAGVNNADAIPMREYDKLMDCEVDLVLDNDYDEEGHNYGIVWGTVEVPPYIWCE